MPTPPLPNYRADNRTDEIGLFNFADAYATCARALNNARPADLRFGDPIDFLCFHAAELCLKAFLRSTGTRVRTLSSNAFGHSYERLFAAATANGLSVSPGTKDLFLDAQRNELPILSRYIRTGTRKAVAFEDVYSALRELRAAVKGALLAAQRQIGDIGEI